MILVCRDGLDPSRIGEIRAILARRGLEAVESRADGRTLLTVRADPGALEDLAPRALPGVESVITTDIRFPRTARRPDGERTVVEVGDRRIGDGTFAVVAGPCAVESREQILEAAETVAAAGGTMLRGGAYKPRTSPYSFRGLREEGLRLLAEARERTGLPVVTEIMDPRNLEAVLEHADMLQIGCRNMANAPLLAEAGRSGAPVLLKRGMSSTITEVLLAAEALLLAGTDKVVLCERGIRSFDTTTRNVLDLSAVPALRSKTHLPILVDPSHGAGRSDFVPALARAAAGVGADGLLIEVHPRPEMALSDGSQSLRPEQLEPLVRQCRAIFEIGREETP
jgi:3-deoxy-7-phosphoheptulonate synthase